MSLRAGQARAPITRFFSSACCQSALADHGACKGQAKLADLALELCRLLLEQAAVQNQRRCAGHELVILGEALPGRQLFGIDLAAGMVDLAEQKLTQAGLR